MKQIVNQASDPPLLRRSAAIVRQRSDVFDALDVHARSRECGDCTLATTARPTDPNFEILDSELRSLFRSLLGSALAGERRPLTTPLEAASATAGPAERITTRIGDRDCCVVETGVDECDSSRNAFLLGFGDLGHE